MTAAVTVEILVSLASAPTVSFAVLRDLPAAVTAEIASLASAPTVSTSFAALRNPPAALLDKFFEPGCLFRGLLCRCHSSPLRWRRLIVRWVSSRTCVFSWRSCSCWKPSLPAAVHYSYYSACEKATSEDRAPRIPDMPLRLRATKLPLLSVSLNGNK